MSSLIPILIITVLIVLNGLFVAAEFAIVGAPRTAIERRAVSGDRAAGMVRRILRDPRRQDRFIATAQLGITLASLGLGMYGEHVLAEWIASGLEGLGWLRVAIAHTVASVLAVAILTYFHIVLGEMIPKSLALQKAERVVLWITPILIAIQYAVYPFVVALNGIGNGLLHLVGIRRQESSIEHYRTPEELQFIVQESQAGGLLRQESAEVLRELLEFGDLLAGEVMMPRVRVTGLPAGATLEQVTEVVRASPHTRYPVYRGSLDDIVGMVHIKDLLRRMLDGRAVRITDARPIPYVPESATIDSVLAAMRQARTQMAVVMDEHGGTAGLITIEDLFDEVVGEIDEGPARPRPIYRDTEGRMRVAGTVRIEEVGEALGVVLEHEDVDTVSGLVLALLGRPPTVGDTVVYDEVQFEVTVTEGHGVRECIAIPLAPPLGSEDHPAERDSASVES